MAPGIVQRIVRMGLAAWLACALAFSLALPCWSQSLPSPPPDFKIEAPDPDLSPEIRAFWGIWEGEWKGDRPVVSTQWGGFEAGGRVVLAVEKVERQSARVVYAHTAKAESKVQPNWGRYNAGLTLKGGRLELSFQPAEDHMGLRRPLTFFVNKSGRLEGHFFVIGRSVEIEMQRRDDSRFREALLAGGKAPKPTPESARVEPAPGGLVPGGEILWKPRRGIPEVKWGLYSSHLSTPDLAPYWQGREHLRRGEVDAALTAFTRALEVNPRLGEGFAERGLIHGKKGRYEQAIADFTYLIGLDPKDTGGFYNRGLAYVLKGDFGHALPDFEQALKLQVQDAQTLYVRGYVHFKQGRTDLAKSDYQAARQKNPGWVESLGSVPEGDLGRYGEILAGKALSLPQKALLPHKQEALALARRGQHDQAIAEFGKALEADPKDAEALNNRGNLLTLKGRYDQAVADLTKAIELNPRYGTAYYNRGLAHFHKGSYESAIADFTKAIEFKPKDAEAYTNRGLAYEQKGEHLKAVADFERALALNPKLSEAHLSKAVNLEKAGRKDEAREAYEAFVRNAPPEAAAQVEQVKRKLTRP